MDYERVEDASPYKPWKIGKLLPPTERNTSEERGSMVLLLSSIDENIPSAGSEPDDTFCSQVCRMPDNLYMFVSCTGFMSAAAIHAYFHTFPDLIAIFGITCVSISSPLCDAFCIYYAIFDDEAQGYVKTAVGVGEDSKWVADEIERHQAAPQVLCTDRWNNLTRLVDRSVCVFITLPSLLFFVYSVRPSLLANLQYFCLFGAGFLCNLCGQRLRSRNPCGFRILPDDRRRVNCFSGRRVLESDYRCFEVLHICWHAFLIVAFCASALDR